jgi:hypothetical protein
VDADGSPKKDKEKVTEFLTWNISSSLVGTITAPKTLAPFFSVNTFLFFLTLQKIVQLEPYPDSKLKVKTYKWGNVFYYNNLLQQIKDTT